MRLLIKATIRIVLVWIAIELVIAVSRSISSILTFRPGYESERWAFAGSTVIPFAIGIIILGVIWWKTDWLAGVITGHQDTNSFTISTSNLALVTVGIRIIGIILLVNVLPDIVGYVGYYLTYVTIEPDYFHLVEGKAQVTRTAVTLGVQLIIGIGLLIGTRGIVRIIDKVWDKAHMAHEYEEPVQEKSGEDYPPEA